MNTKKIIYLDYNATTPLHPQAREAMRPYLDDVFGNASSFHQVGQAAQKGLEESREKMASLIGASDPQEIVFTSGGTESDNLAVKGAAFALKKKGDHIITSAIEHHAVYNTCQYLAKNHGFKVTYLPVGQGGRVDPDDLKKALLPETILVTIMTANNEIGTIQPIEELASICVEKKVLFHTDAVQAGGKLPLSVAAMQVGMLTLSGHKFYGPKGVGVLYIRKGIKVQPLFHGGHHERNRRAGTENMAGIAGMVKAAEVSWAAMAEENKRLAALRDRLERGLLQKISYARVNGHPDHRLSNTLNMSFEFIEGEGIILSLDMEGIAVSTGSACTSGTLEPSHVLTAMGIPVDISHGSVRFSLGKDTTENDIDHVIAVTPRIIERLRSMSPLWEDKQKGVTTVYADDDHHHSHDE